MDKKILFAAIFFIMMFSPISYAKDNHSKNKQESAGNAIFVMAVPQEIQVEEQCLKEASPQLSYSLSIPKLNGFSNQKFERKINKYLKSRTTDLRKELQSAWKQNESTQNEVRYELMSNYKVLESMPNYFVLSLFDYTYTGGSHGQPNQSYLVIDLAENKLLTLNQLFESDVNYQAQISTIIRQQINARRLNGELFYDDLFHTLTVNENERFYIATNGDLVIVFNVYEIAPYASGITKFVIPKEMLEGYILNQ